MAGWVKSLIYYVAVRQQQSGAVEACWGHQNLALLNTDFILYSRDVEPTLFVNSSFQSLRRLWIESNFLFLPTFELEKKFSLFIQRKNITCNEWIALGSSTVRCVVIYFKAWSVSSRVAQWKRAGPITQRSEDQNLALLFLFYFNNN